MKKTFRNYVKGKDFFGHLITLNFDKQGDSYKTVVGGVFSLIIQIGMAIYITLNIKKMMNYEDNKVTSLFDVVDLSK